jgi:hypothetical protein
MLAKQDTVKNLISMSCAESNKIIPKKMDWENIQQNEDYTFLGWKM